MAPTALTIRMLGGFSIQYNDREINTSNSRSRKLWLLLAYLVYYRKRCICREELVDLLWVRESADDDRVNPSGALKTTFHRVRTLLNQLDESLGQTLIPLTNGNYAWNREIKFQYDVDEFEKLVKIGETSENEEERLAAYLKAVELYRGDFLPSFSTEPWVIPVSAYYHNIYIHALLNALPILENNNRFQEAVTLCRSAIKVAPDHEGLYQHLMEDLLNLGKPNDVITVYNDMRSLFLVSFGIMPSEELRAIYREALYTLNHQTLDIHQILAQLKEPEHSIKSAFFCDYDIFKTLYHTEVRNAAGNGKNIPVCLLTIKSKNPKEKLSRRSLDRCMENFQGVIKNSLRPSDIVARCGISQYVLLLRHVTHKDCFPVCERLAQAFYRQFPHSPGEISFEVNPPERKEAAELL